MKKTLGIKNYGRVEIKDPTTIIHVEPIIFLPTVPLNYGIYGVQNNYSVGTLGTINQPEENDSCCCVLM